MNPDLERRYRWLLGAYPAAYRANHEAEILSTLSQVSGEGRRWPDLREAWALVTGGIRSRAVAAGDGTPTGVAMDGLHLGAVLLVAGNAMGAVFAAYAGMSNRWQILLGLAWVFAFAALVRGGRLLPVLASATAAVISLGVNFDVLSAQPVQPYVWALAIAGSLLPAVLIAGLAWRRPLPGRSPLLLLVPALPYALAMGIVSTPFFLTTTLFVMMVAASAVALLLLPLDPRPAIAVAVFLVPTVALLVADAAVNVTLWVEPSWMWPSVWALICVSLGASGLRASRRFARI